jgi:hypothetical protein
MVGGASVVGAAADTEAVFRGPELDDRTMRQWRRLLRLGGGGGASGGSLDDGQKAEDAAEEVRLVDLCSERFSTCVVPAPFVDQLAAALDAQVALCEARLDRVLTAIYPPPPAAAAASGAPVAGAAKPPDSVAAAVALEDAIEHLARAQEAVIRFGSLPKELPDRSIFLRPNLPLHGTQHRWSPNAH